MNTSYLTDNQTQIWRNIAYELAANLTIQLQALNYYLQYRQHFKNNNLIDSEQRTITIFKIAYLLAEKSVPTFTIQGKKISTFAFSFNALLKDKQTNTEDFMYNLKEMVKAIEIQDKQLQEEINIFVRKFSFCMTFYNKFWSAFGKIKFYPKLTEDQEAIIKSFVWVLFITSKNFCLGETLDIVDCTCLMAIVFRTMISSKSLQCKDIILEDSYFSGSLHIKNDPKAQHLLLDFFRIKDLTTFNRLIKTFNNFLNFIKSNDIVNIQNIFTTSNIELNYQKLDKHYQINLQQNIIDQRSFLKDRINNNLHKNKFTPLGGKRHGKIRSDQFPQKILSYQIEQQELQNNQKENQQKFKNQNIGKVLLKNLKLKSATPTTLLIKSTPTTQAMQLYNFLFDKTKYFNVQQHGQNPIYSILKQFLINDVAPQKLTQHMLNKRIKLTLGYYFYIVNHIRYNQVLSEDDQLQYLVLCIEICCFVLNLTTSKNNCLDRVIQQFQLSYDDIWPKISELINQDATLPLQIKIHLFDLETTIVTMKLWNHSQKIDQSQYLQIFSKRTTPLMEKLYLRIIHHIAYQIHLLSTQLKLSQEIEHNTFLTIQFALKQYPEMLINHNIDQLLLCSIYPNCRIKDPSIKFNTIINLYTQLNNLTKQFYNQLIENIPITEQEQNGDIIKFYNVIFLVKMKGFLSDLKNQKITKKKHDENLIKTPIKKILPPSILSKKVNQSQGFFAYSESPLLKQKRKQNIKQFIGQGANLKPMKSKQLKKFNEGQQPLSSLEETLSLINKKFGRQNSQNQLRFVNYRNMSK